MCGYYNIILRACLYSFIYFSSSTLNVKKNIQDNKITKTHIWNYGEIKYIKKKVVRPNKNNKTINEHNKMCFLSLHTDVLKIH